MSDYEVLYDKLLVERMPEEAEKGGLEIPARYRDKQSMGTVLDVGDGRLSDSGDLIPLLVRPGDIVLFNVHSGVELPEKDGQFLILREDEVLARVKKEKPVIKAV